MKLEVGDKFRRTEKNSLIREVVEVCDWGYRWKYIDSEWISTNGQVNVWSSNMGKDPFFDFGWERVKPSSDACI